MNWKPQKPRFGKFKKDIFTKAAQVSEFIYQIGEYDALRKSSKKVPLKEMQSKEFKAKVQYLKDCLQKYRKLTGYGRGIAAVQVGIPERFAVIYTPDELILIINPTITQQATKMLRYPEICMSANPIIVPTTRPAWIEFDYYDEKGTLQHWNTKDITPQGQILNRVFHHEIDHLEGIINLDHITNPKELLLQSDPTFYKNATFKKVT